MLSYLTYNHSFLTPIVSFWNDVFRGYRHFMPLETYVFRTRIVEQLAFDPQGLILALDKNRVVGMVHAFRAASHSYFVYRENPCGRNGSIALLAVAREYRHRGIGKELLKRAEGYLNTCLEKGSFIFAGEYWVPLYHTLEGPRQPFWGDTEIIGIAENNKDCIGFLEHHGYMTVGDEGQEITMVAPLRTLDEVPKIPLRDYGLREVRIGEDEPWEGRIDWYPAEERGNGYARFGEFLQEGIALVRGDTVTAHLLWYPMRKGGHVALWDLRVSADEQGKGLGSYLLDRSLWTMAQKGYHTVELHTNTERNAKAVAMYRRRDFSIVERWVGLRKRVAD